MDGILNNFLILYITKAYCRELGNIVFTYVYIINIFSYCICLEHFQ